VVLDESSERVHRTVAGAVNSLLRVRWCRPELAQVRLVWLPARLPRTPVVSRGMKSGVGTVRSADGTQIAYQREGSGPAVVLVGGGLDDGSENAVLIPALAAEFTVYNYARRGRGGSGDTQPYTVQRELEDLAAVLHEVGGRAHVFGASSGGALALEAAAAGLPIERLAVYDVPYSVTEDAVDRWRAYRAELDEALARQRIDEALAAFMRLGGASDDELEGARSAPFWDGLLVLAPTLAYDAAVLGDNGPPSDRLANIGQETTVLIRSTSDPYMPALPVEFFAAAADAVAAALPHVARCTIDAPGHAVDAAAVAPPVLAFFAGEDVSRGS
jgi:pimeloyl-ACP methyl ester carboxylesterase